MIIVNDDIKLDDNGVRLHPWMMVKNGENLFIPEKSRGSMVPDLESDGMISTRQIQVISLDLLCIKLHMDPTQANANMVAYKFDGMEYLSLQSWVPPENSRAH